MNLSFQPWNEFYARKNSDSIRRWLKAVGDASVDAFRGGMRGGSKDVHSRPGEFPAIQEGALRSTVRAEVKGDQSVTVGTSRRYSIFLRMGTSKMQRRKMSDDALKAGIKSAGRLARWVEWSRV